MDCQNTLSQFFSLTVLPLVNRKNHLIKVVLALFILVAFKGYTWAQQYYHDRPEINNLESRKLSDTELKQMWLDRSRWKKMKEAMFYFLAQIDALYPNSEIHFLARDAEYLHDIATIIYENDSRLNQFKLSNISGQTMESTKLKQYLHSIGLNKPRSNQNIVFIDSGYQGSIVDKINSILKSNWPVHLIESWRESIPESKFTQSFYGSHLVGHMEFLPHFTEVSSDYRIDGNKISVISSGDGDARNAILLMQDLNSTFRSKQKKRKYHNTVHYIKVLAKSTFFKDNHLPELKQAQNYLKKLGKSTYESLISDIKRSINTGNYRPQNKLVYDKRTHKEHSRLIPKKSCNVVLGD